MKKEFNINTTIYSEDKLKEAIVDFTEVWNISFKGNLITIEWNTSNDCEEFFNEYMNYVIWLINEWEC